MTYLLLVVIVLVALVTPYSAFAMCKTVMVCDSRAQCQVVTVCD